MDQAMALGVIIVVAAGLLQGSGAWPIKLMRKYQYEHWAFIVMLGGLIVIPWVMTLLLCPHAIEAYRSVDSGVLIKSNLFSLSWGVANILCLLCFMRIGFCLTGGILTGLGVGLGVTIPMVFKGSGLFKDAADITSPAGMTVIGGVAVMLLGVVLTSLAGFGRDQEQKKTQATSGNFAVGLVMAIAAGVLSCGISFAFVYCQGPIVAAMKANGAGEIAANFAVWAVGLMGGGLINVLYPAYLMTKRKNWGVLGSSGRELGLALIMCVNMFLSVVLLGKGMLMLGVLGASVGFGVQQAMQMLGSQGVGFISGEWRGVGGRPRALMYTAIGVLIAAAVVMAYGNSVKF